MNSQPGATSESPTERIEDMGEEAGTLNQDAGSSSVSTMAAESAPELMPTVDDSLRNVPQEASVQDQDDKQQGAGVDKQENTRFDQHPRFQELVKEKNELRRMVGDLQKQIESVQQSQKPQDSAEGGSQQKVAGDSAPWEKDSDALLDAFNDNPAAFLKQFADRVKQDAVAEFKQNERQQTEQQKLYQTYEKYAERNPDFNELWDSGEITRFMEANPGHNPISAHQEMTWETRKKSAVEEALRAERDKLTRQAAIKRGAAVLGGPSAATNAPGGIPDDLKNPMKYGGTTSVLAARLAAMRSKAAVSGH